VGRHAEAGFITTKTRLPSTAGLGGFVVALAFAFPASAAAGITRFVNPLAGTKPGAETFGGGHNFPGAAVPFGMVQWSPDTSPFKKHSGGYDFRDAHLRGFSLTHLSGAGCSLYGDFPFTPTIRRIRRSPAPHGAAGLTARFTPRFSHAREQAAPGYYRLALGASVRHSIVAELTATKRTGSARFTFPRTRNASIIIDAGGSANPDDSASVQIHPARREITGSASSGYFCAQRPRYKVYFAARFSRPLRRFGTWHQQALHRGSTSASDAKPPSRDPSDTAQAGAYVGFDTRHSRSVGVRVGISFVGVGGARQNLRAENRGFAFRRVAATARKRWARVLGLVKVSGGSTRSIRTFYTALYHVFLAPRTFSDADGRYIGMDGQIHTAAGRVQYADFSGWDIYRSQIQLLAMLMPGRASDLVDSLLTNAAQSGCLPRWPYANGQSMTMVGDPSDPIIASAAAFGARGFDAAAALQVMVKGATQRCATADGSYVERQGLDAYRSLGYVPLDLDVNQRNANSLYGSPDAVWASASTTLEYAIADFAIAQFAARVAHHPSVYGEFIRRSGNWRNLFNPNTGYVEPRFASGAFPAGYDDLKGGGFAEGNAAQYTWMVPHDPAGLAAALGGAPQAAARLDYFLRALNASHGGTHTDHALLGNEPNLNAPWLYDWLGQPYKTQAAVRRSIGSLYGPAPDGYPGNDDLGTLSAWYVFGALGIYPEVPGVGVLAVSSPLFRSARVRLPGGALRIAAKGASARARYIRSMSFDGRPQNRPWTTFCAMARGASLRFRLGRKPNPSWGSHPADQPPSFGPQSAMPRDQCAVP
jgi:predicted alpha-1,2-mannosidase